MNDHTESYIAPMTGSEFRARLRELGRTQSGFAREIGGSQRSVTRWISEGPPPEVAYLMDLLTTLELHIGSDPTHSERYSKFDEVDTALDRFLVQATASGHRDELIAEVERWLRTVANVQKDVRSGCDSSGRS